MTRKIAVGEKGKRYMKKWKKQLLAFSVPVASTIGVMAMPASAQTAAAKPEIHLRVKLSSIPAQIKKWTIPILNCTLYNNFSSISEIAARESKNISWSTSNSEKTFIVLFGSFTGSNTAKSTSWECEINFSMVSAKSSGNPYKNKGIIHFKDTFYFRDLRFPTQNDPILKAKVQKICGTFGDDTATRKC